MYKEPLLDKLNRKFGRYSVRNLMMIIVCSMLFVYLMDMLVFPATEFTLSSKLYFDRAAIFKGEIWRVVTFIFLPPNSGVVFILFSLYFYWLIGDLLESQWGSFRFNVFYLCGMLGTIAAGFITGYATNYYLNMSLFLAFALLFPDFVVNIFFVLPVKVKWLALIDLLALIVSFLTESWSGRLVLLVSLGNVILFFWNDFIRTIKNAKRKRDFRRNNADYWR